MADPAYKRVSTDQQSTNRQNLVLAEAGASSRLHPLQRTKSGELLTYARPGDTVHVSEMFRLVRGTRGTRHILDVRTSRTRTASPCASTTARSRQ